MDQLERQILPAAEFWVRKTLSALSGTRLVLNRRGELVPSEMKLFCFDCVDSTMNVAKEFARCGELEGHIPHIICLTENDSISFKNACMILAREQSSGRGRLQRSWHSQKDAGLYLTCLSSVSFGGISFAGFSLAVGVAICRALSGLGVTAALKWPNDIVIFDQTQRMLKLGGVLVETYSGNSSEERFVSTGVGINIQTPQGNTSLPATSLVDLGYDNISISKLFAAVAEQYWLMFAQYCECGFTRFKDEWLSRSVLQGMVVRALAVDREVTGKVCGVADNGGLLLADENGLQTEFLCGDVTIRMIEA
ncbi:MAG: biotin--[acetyl-CoA-carboxylase] ligase [Deltaproteobacteria bacterium]|nr:biotin--[acetyl-CoA-carboxylase] ligase [Deltaproteobacteria bacterium]